MIVPDGVYFLELGRPPPQRRKRAPCQRPQGTGYSDPVLFLYICNLINESTKLTRIEGGIVRILEDGQQLPLYPTRPSTHIEPRIRLTG
jgi:hypothetical protein